MQDQRSSLAAFCLSSTHRASTTSTAPTSPVRPPSSSTESASRHSETSNALRRACAVCGNVYDKAFEVLMDGKRYTFDSFECAIHLLAPTCAHCGCRIVGHGLEAAGAMYCCAHCAEKSGENRLRDRA